MDMCVSKCALSGKEEKASIEAVQTEEIDDKDEGERD